MKEQARHCQQLKLHVEVLRLSRTEKAKEVAKLQEEERKQQEKMRAKRQQRFRQRQRHQWAQIRSYRRNQEEIKAERRFQLHQELKATVKQRRDRALQDFIRVNLR